MAATCPEVIVASLGGIGFPSAASAYRGGLTGHAQCDPFTARSQENQRNSASLFLARWECVAGQTGRPRTSEKQSGHHLASERNPAMGEIQALWRRDASSGCVGGDCDTVFPRQSYRGRAGHPVILEVIPAAER